MAKCGRRKQCQRDDWKTHKLACTPDRARVAPHQMRDTRVNTE